MTTSISAKHNLAAVAEHAFERHGDYESLLFEGRWHRSGELFERAQRLGTGLRELGIAPGERVVVTMANCPEVGIAYNALWRAGAVVTPASFLLSTHELRHIVSDAEASAVITTPEFADRVREATASVESVRHLISSGGVDGMMPLASLEESDPGPIME